MRLETAQPVDLLLAAVLLAAADLAVVLDAPAAVQVPFGLLLLLALPGYAFAALVFPERHEPRVGDDVDLATTWKSSISGLERAALTLATSLALVTLVGLVLNYTTGVTATTAAHAVTGLTAFLLAAALLRRLLTPPAKRYRPALLVPVPQGWGRAEMALGVVLAIAMASAVAAATYAILQPRDPVHFTETYLLGSDGRPACYPAVYANGSYGHREGEECPGVAGSVTFGLANHEDGRRTYHVRTVWTNETVEDNETRIDAVVEWQRWTVTLDAVAVDPDPTADHEPQYERTLSVPPPPGPGPWRLSFQVYLERPAPLAPTEAFLAGPYRHLHIWIEA